MSLTMLRVLLISIAISVVYGQTKCPRFPTYKNIGSLQKNLNGTFSIVYTTETVVNCHRVKYTIDMNNVTTAYVESHNCCMKVDNCDFRSTELSYSIDPLVGHTTGCPTLASRNGAMKLLATTGTGTSLCLITGICQSGRYADAVIIMCRQPSLPLPLILYVILNNLLGLLGLSTVSGLQPVNQDDCVFPTNNCPA